jgi:DNA-binding NtrC family response regulator
VPLLVNHFVAEFSRRDDKCIHTVASGVLEQLQAYDWPGNIRELEHVIERAVITSTDGVLYLIEPLVCENVETSPAATARLNDFERLHIERILSTTSWRIEGPAGGGDGARPAPEHVAQPHDQAGNQAPRRARYRTSRSLIDRPIRSKTGPYCVDSSSGTIVAK